jgi:hypothetical protein
MKFGIPISFTLHAVFLGGGLFLFKGTPTLPNDRAIIPIDIITIAEDTNIKAAIKRQEPAPEPASEPEPEPEPEIPAAELPLENTPEEAAPAAEAPLEPAPTADSTETADPTETADLRQTDEAAETTPDSEAETQPEPEPVFSLDDLSALIDRSRDSQRETNPQKILQSEETLYAFADVTRRSVGAGDGLALSEIDALRAAMYKCWRIPVDAKDPESLIIPVEVKLHRDGYLASAALKNAGSIYGSSNPYMKIAADNALRAVSKCAPYDFLPVDRYDSWKQMTLTFRPILTQ